MNHEWPHASDIPPEDREIILREFMEMAKQQLPIVPPGLRPRPRMIKMDAVYDGTRWHRADPQPRCTCGAPASTRSFDVPVCALCKRAIEEASTE